MVRWTTAVPAINAEGSATALATVSTLATLTLVLPRFTTSRPGPEFSPAQLTFAAVASLALYALFVVVQTVRHRDYFLPEAEPSEHAPPPSDRAALISLGLQIVLLPETLAAVRNARRDRVHTSFDLASGSAMASIGLTIPAIAVATIWLEGPLVLGLGSMQGALLAITVVVSALTVLSVAFVFLALNP